MKILNSVSVLDTGTASAYTLIATGLLLSPTSTDSIKVTPSADNVDSFVNVVDSSDTVSWFSINADGRIAMNGSGGVGINENTPDAQLHVTAGSASTKALVVKSASSQTENLFEAQVSGGDPFVVIDSNGTIFQDMTVNTSRYATKIRAEDAGTQLTWNWGVSSHDNNGDGSDPVMNSVFSMGWNYDPGGGPEDIDMHAVRDGWEYNYYQSGEARIERHVGSTMIPGEDEIRPITLSVITAGANVGKSEVAFGASTIYFNEEDQSTQIAKMQRSSGVTTFTMLNMSGNTGLNYSSNESGITVFGLGHSGTTFNTLSLTSTSGSGFALTCGSSTINYSVNSSSFYNFGGSSGVTAYHKFDTQFFTDAAATKVAFRYGLSGSDMTLSFYDASATTKPTGDVVAGLVTLGLVASPQLVATALNSSTPALVIKGAVSQSANLTEWQDNSGNVVASMSATGGYTVSSMDVPGTITIGDPGILNGFINSNDGIYVNTDCNNDGTNGHFIIATNRTGASGGTELFKVTDDGQVIIGSGSGSGASVNSGLDVAYNANTEINAIGSTNPSLRAISTTSSVIAKLQATNGPFTYVGSESDHATHVITNNIPRITITNSGLVGINDGGPGAQLQIVSKDSLTSTFRLRAAATITRTINNVALTSNVATITTSAAHGILVGSTVVITGLTTTVLNGTYVVASTPTTTTFTYSKTNANITSVSDSGTATVNQSANIQEWQDASSTVIGSFIPLGSGRAALRAGSTTYTEIGVNGSNFPYIKSSANGFTIDTNNASSGYSNVHVLTNTGYGLRISASNSNSGVATDGRLFVDTGVATGKGLVIKGTTSQSANMLEIQNSSSTAMVTVKSDGKFGMGTNPTVQLDVLATGSTGVIAQFGINGAAGLFTIGYGSVITGAIELNSSPYGPLALNTQSNQDILILPHGTGKVGINQTSPSAKLHVVSGSESVADISTKNKQIFSMVRTIPTDTVTNNVVDIGSISLTNGSAHIQLGITIPSGGYSTSKYYNFTVLYHQTANVWTTVIPFTSSGPYDSGTQDTDLEALVNGPTLSLRLRRTLGSVSGTAYITLEHQGVVANAFTASTTVSTGTAPTSYFPATSITQIGGHVGINQMTPLCGLDVVGGVSFRRITTATNYTVLSTDALVAVTNTSSARTITLPAANTMAPGQFVTIVDESGGAATNNITINRAGSDTINGATSYVLNNNYQSVTLYSTGSSAWYTTVNNLGGSSGDTRSTPTAVKTTTYTITDDDHTILADASSAGFTVTLPDASTVDGYEFVVKKIDTSSNTVTIGRNGSQQIDGSATDSTITIPKTALRFKAYSSNWYIV